MNNGLITIIENEPRVSHRMVAEQTENQVKAITQIIQKYKDEFDEFGQCPFKMEGVKNSVGAVNEQKTYYLNEPQATFLMTLLRNKPIVVEFKKRLVKEFYLLKEESLQVKQNQDQPELLHVILKLVENQQRQTDAIFSLVETMQHRSALPEQPKQINHHQRKQIRDLINKKVNAVRIKTGMDKQTIAPGIYIAFKNEFNLDEYGELPNVLFDEAIDWLEAYDPFDKYNDIKKALETAVF